MKSTGVYLTFAQGNCAKAFARYEAIFGKKCSTMMKYGTSPMKDNVPPNQHDNILHASLDIGMGNAFSLMGCDANPIMHTQKLVAGNNTSVSLCPDTMEETKRLFDALSQDDGAEVTMPLAKQFWGSYFGTLTDAFGIHWMLDFALNDDNDNEKKETEEGDNKRKTDGDEATAKNKKSKE